jgi:hypothetical protein
VGSLEAGLADSLDLVASLCLETNQMNKPLPRIIKPTRRAIRTAIIIGLVSIIAEVTGFG